ncbi:MAG TPA: hypothetical protein VLJ17_15205 [Xanthobacteraceae bacterium]|nr:hypothetical protein [Xanthobacteraceae bacterium]
MTVSVRIYGHTGLEQLVMPTPRQFTGDTVFVLVQPYVFQENLTAGAVAVSSTSNSDSRVRLLRIEVQDGGAIRYEINPPNREGGVVVANVNSPILSGHDNFYFRQGWSLSVIDASTVAS